MYWGREEIKWLECEACGGDMPLVRREPHPSLPPGSELRSFECVQCGRIQTVDVEILRPEGPVGTQRRAG
jgi:Zn ribbon nucleic-acid-binding protein